MHGSVAVIVRPGDVLGRAVVVEPLAHIQLTLVARPRHRGQRVICIFNLLLAAQVSGLEALLHEPRSHRLLLARHEATIIITTAVGGGDRRRGR